MQIKILNIMMALALLVSCARMNDGDGEVRFAIDPEISSPLDVSLITKSDSQTAFDVYDFSLNIEGTDIQGVYRDLMNKVYKIKTGEYIAFAESCTIEESVSVPDEFGSVRYAGQQAFEVHSLEMTKDVTIKCSIANARVIVELTDDFTSYFDESLTTVSISSSKDFSERSLQMLPSDNVKEAFFIAGDCVYVKVETIKKGAANKMTYSLPIIDLVNADTSYKISLSVAETTTGGITFNLTGSEMTVNDFLSLGSYTVGSVVEDN